MKKVWLDGEREDNGIFSEQIWPLLQTNVTKIYSFLFISNIFLEKDKKTTFLLSVILGSGNTRHEGRAHYGLLSFWRNEAVPRRLE